MDAIRPSPFREGNATMDQGDPPASASARPGQRWWYLLLVLPFIAMLLPQTYDAAAPAVGGLPFFYWYQLMWIVITGLLTIVVYALTR